jgi:fluoroquinolone resistance protein
MEKPYISDQLIEKRLQLDFAEYENCTFRSCNFEAADFKNFQFVGCHFEDCNLSLVKLGGASLQQIHFTGCKLQGLHFEACNPFLLEYQFTQCVLNLSSFYQTKSKKTVFTSCVLHEVDFSEADFSEAKFIACDLAGALFDRTILEKADFLSAYNYTISPSLNRLKRAKFSREGLSGLLSDIGIEIS